MLTEHFAAAIGAPTKAISTSVAKDVSIFLFEHQPLVALRSSFKKSATQPNCLAISDTHVFTAQADKAVVHVYSRERSSQEATVPFTERITCLALACEDAILVMGTAEGRIFLWETTSGRQITTAQSHLQAVNQLAVDAASNFLISISLDSTCHVWSLPTLMSFAQGGIHALAPLRSFTMHRSAVRAIAIGHSDSCQNIVITAAEDKTCLLWEYQTCAVLRTYLLPYVPSCIALDAADRAFFVGYENGSVQRIDLYAKAAQAVDDLHQTVTVSAPLQPKAMVWTPADKSIGPTCSLTLSFDGTIILSGHASGTVLSWDVANGHMKSILAQGPLPGPINNLSMLPVSGFHDRTVKGTKLDVVTKPKFGVYQGVDSDRVAVPGNYALNVGLLAATSADNNPTVSPFQQALLAPSFPQAMLDEGLSELAAWSSGGAGTSNDTTSTYNEDFMALDDAPSDISSSGTQQEVADLKAQLDALRRVQQASFDKMATLQLEKSILLQREQVRMLRHGTGASINGNGTAYPDTTDSEDVNMDSSEESD